MRLIDADALKEALKSNCKPDLCHDYNTAWCDSCCRAHDFEDLIDNALTVQRPQGTWVCGNILKLDYYCSECRATGEPCQPYCAWCGARMKEVK